MACSVGVQGWGPGSTLSFPSTICQGWLGSTRQRDRAGISRWGGRRSEQGGGRASTLGLAARGGPRVRSEQHEARRTAAVEPEQRVVCRGSGGDPDVRWPPRHGLPPPSGNPLSYPKGSLRERPAKAHRALVCKDRLWAGGGQAG